MMKLLSERKRKKQLKRQIHEIFYPLPWRDRQIKMLSRYCRLKYVPVEHRDLAYKLMPKPRYCPYESVFEIFMEWFGQTFCSRGYDVK